MDEKYHWCKNKKTGDEISSKPGLLLDFQLLKASSNSSSWRVYSCNTISITFMNCLISLEVGTEDAKLAPISIKNLLNPLAIIFWSEVSTPSVSTSIPF